ncbi:MAG: GNAT family N-acetyltransferase [Hyphomicrobiales bacterium]
MSAKGSAAIRVVAATPARWDDLVRLFGARGACAGCWCMWWRRAPAAWRAGKGTGNRAALRRLVASGDPPGLLAYAGREPVGWIAVAPREAYPRLAGARTLRPVDDTPVWSVTCFFVAKDYRRRGVTVALLEGAAAYAARRGAVMLEGYPVEARTGALPDAFAWTGLPGAFRKAGFREVARPSATRSIVRRALRRR